MLQSKCQNCADRRVGCHAQCEKYAEYVRKNEDIKRKRREERENYAVFGKQYEKSTRKRLNRQKRGLTQR